jgi:hypothetical protein
MQVDSHDEDARPNAPVVGEIRRIADEARHLPLPGGHKLLAHREGRCEPDVDEVASAFAVDLAVLGFEAPRAFEH